MIDSSTQLMFILSSAVYSVTDKPLTYTTHSRPKPTYSYEWHKMLEERQQRIDLDQRQLIYYYQRQTLRLNLFTLNANVFLGRLPKSGLENF